MLHRRCPGRPRRHRALDRRAQLPGAQLHARRHAGGHVHSTQNAQDRGEAVVDIFRVEQGKIVEHWDVIQSIPAESANRNSMF